LLAIVGVAKFNLEQLTKRFNISEHTQVLSAYLFWVETQP
jgi:hypothetical protein